MFGDLGGVNLVKLYVDSIFFIIGIVLATIIVCKNYRGSLRIILLFYVFITFSAYNIFIKPVQDYNIPIPRTFIFYFKVYNGLSFYDIFLLICSSSMIISFLFEIKRKGLFSNKNIFNTLFIRDLILFIVGLLGAYFYQGYGGRVDWESHYRLARGVLTAVVLTGIAPKILRQVTNIHESKKLLNIFSLLNLINIISEFASSRFLSGISWERAGHSIFLLDQTNSYLVMIYAPILLVQWPIYNKITKATAFITIALLFIDYHKIAYFLFGFGILLLGIIAIITKKKLPNRIRFIFPFLIFGFLFIIIQLLSSTHDDMRTRSGQLDGVLEAFDKHPINIISGMGIGGMFKRQTLTEDAGEIKAIDAEKYSLYQNAIQVPFLFQIKEAGIIGGGIVIVVFFMHLKKSIKLIKLHWYFATSCVFIGVTGVLTRGIIFVDPQAGIYFCLAYISIVLNIAIIKKLRGDSFKIINV